MMTRTRRADLIATPETALPMHRAALPPDYLDAAVRAFARQRQHTCWSASGQRRPGHTTPTALLGLRAGRRAQLPLRQASPGALRRIHPAGLPLVRRPDAHPARRLTRGAPVQAPFELARPAGAAEHLLRGRVRRRDRRAAADSMPGRPRRRCCSTCRTSPGSATRWRCRSTCRSRRCARWKPRRPMLRATNTGATAVIDPRGRVQAQLPPFIRAGVLSAHGAGHRAAMTPYIRFGNCAGAGAAVHWLLGGLWFCGAIGTRLKG